MTGIDVSLLGARALTEAQREEIESIVETLKGEEVKAVYRIKPLSGAQLTPRWLGEALADGTIAFFDGTERRWYVEPSGRSTWRT